MSRVNDVGGVEGFGPVDGDDEPFHADWEARMHALNVVLLRKGVYNLDELRDAVERIPAREYLAMSYYERRLRAINDLLRRKGVTER
jgi:nitrile hydratase